MLADRSALVKAKLMLTAFAIAVCYMYLYDICNTAIILHITTIMAPQLLADTNRSRDHVLSFKLYNLNTQHYFLSLLLKNIYPQKPSAACL